MPEVMKLGSETIWAWKTPIGSGMECAMWEIAHAVGGTGGNLEGVGWDQGVF